jgi:hypothetical protein
MGTLHHTQILWASLAYSQCCPVHVDDALRYRLFSHTIETDWNVKHDEVVWNGNAANQSYVQRWELPNHQIDRTSRSPVKILVIFACTYVKTGSLPLH